MNVPLRLRYCDYGNANRTVAAWFLPGHDVKCCLEELVRCGLALPETKLLFIPQSPKDRALAGILVIPGKLQAGQPTPRGLACRKIADRVFIPIDAELHPPVSDAEVRLRLPLPAYFFHPVLGLSGFEATQPIRQLLDAPSEENLGWNFARPGAAPLPELQSISAALPPDLGAMFGDAPSEIGVSSPSDLPPLPNEPSDNPLSSSGRFMQRQLARLIEAATKQLPHTATQRTWVNDLEDWAARQLLNRADPLRNQREKEIQRLLQMFETNPEAALRHALPMNDFAQRGLAPPGGHLGPRNPEFNLKQLGGGPADYWSVGSNLQEALRHRYREMADRELQLGRYRRAAYIYAQLLGDLPSTALALVRGRHFHEAALIYEKHLGNRTEAARCFAEGGLLLEAIERYTQLQRWLDVADLYERLGDPEAAVRNIERAIEDHTTRGDVLRAAELTEQRLRRPDEALRLLLAAWPDSAQAVRCLVAAVELRGRLGRHHEVIDHLTRLARETGLRQLDRPIIHALQPLARCYPDETVRHRLADFCRVRIAAQLRLPVLSTSESSILINHLIQLAPDDKLVARDAHRHQQQRLNQAKRSRNLITKSTADNAVTAVTRIKLPEEIEWLALRRDSTWFYAVGINQRRLTVLRGTWDGSIQSISWPCNPVLLRNTTLLFEPVGGLGREVALAIPGGPPFSPQILPASDLFFSKPCLVTTPSWISTMHFPIAISDRSIWTAHVAAGRGILSHHDHFGTLNRTFDVTQELLEGATRGANAKVCLCATSDLAALALGNRVVLTGIDGRLKTINVNGQVTGLIPTLPHTRAGLLILQESGTTHLWFGDHREIELGLTIAAEKAAFVPGGPLVFDAGDQLCMVEFSLRGATELQRVDVRKQELVAISQTSSVGQFATLSGNGQLTVYQISR